MRKIIISILIVLIASINTPAYAERSKDGPKDDQQRYEDQKRYDDKKGYDNKKGRDDKKGFDGKKDYDDKNRFEYQKRFEEKNRKNYYKRDDYKKRFENREYKKHFNWSQSRYQDSNWRKVKIEPPHNSIFRWHDSRHYLSERFQSPCYRIERIRDRNWDDRFPGLYSYRWHDNGCHYEKGFWHNGRRIRDCILFFDAYDDLVGLGYMYNNSFIFIRDDDEAYHHNDSHILLILLLMLLH